MKRPVMIGVFAHPDDESFGPAGTIALYAKTHDVYLICATRGEAGQNHSPHPGKKIGEIREQELYAAAHIMGVKKVYLLDFIDGTLCNNLYHQLAKKIIAIIKRHQPDILLTFEPRGVSGHIDHVTISLVTNYVFERCQAQTLLMNCLHKSHRQYIKDYFIYFPQGYTDDQIDQTIDVSSVWEIKIKAMKQHKSQQQDVKRILNRINKLPKKEYFLVRKKNNVA